MDTVPSGQYVFLPIDKILFGPGSVASLPAELERLGVERVVLATTRSLTEQGTILTRVKGLIGHRLAATFREVRQHAPASGVKALADEAERLRADALVSLGGGSVIDTVKAANLELARDRGSFRPHLSLPTTLSASEFSPLFGVTDEQTRVKTGSNNPFVTPQVVILDAELCQATPDWLWLGSGMRAVDHAVETIYAPEHQPATDATSLEALRLLFQYLPLSTGSAHTIAARQQCQIAAWLSFFGVQNITLGLSHLLGRQIGPRYDVPHGFTSAVLLPHVMTGLLPQTSDRQALIARTIKPGSCPEDAATLVSALVERLGLPQRLRDLGIPEADLPSLSGDRAEVLRILQSAW